VTKQGQAEAIHAKYKHTTHTYIPCTSHTQASLLIFTVGTDSIQESDVTQIVTKVVIHGF